MRRHIRRWLARHQYRLTDWWHVHSVTAADVELGRLAGRFELFIGRPGRFCRRCEIRIAVSAEQLEALHAMAASVLADPEQPEERQASDRIHAVAFNALTGALAKTGTFARLSHRDQITAAVVTAVREEIARAIAADAPCEPVANCNPHCPDCIRYRQAQRDIEIARGAQ